MGKSFSRLLGGGNGAKVKNRPHVSDHDKAVLDLKVARDRLKRYQKKLDGEAQMLTTQAQALVKEGRKDRALVLLKIKRFKAEQASKADAQLFTVTELLETVEWEGHQAQVLAALSEGTKALNSLHEAMPIEDVEQLMADTQEALEYEQQVNSIIAGAWSPENEDELLEEFEALQKEMAAEAAPAAAAAAAAPAAVAADAAAEAAAAAAAASAAAAVLRPKPAAQQQPAAAVAAEETE
ncbi:Snf7-domain-containing protein, partial [Tribonema minus]